MGQYFSDDNNMAELVSRTPEEDRTRYGNYERHRVERAFVDRIFIAFKPVTP